MTDWICVRSGERYEWRRSDCPYSLEVSLDETGEWIATIWQLDGDVCEGHPWGTRAEAQDWAQRRLIELLTDKATERSRAWRLPGPVGCWRPVTETPPGKVDLLVLRRGTQWRRAFYAEDGPRGPGFYRWNLTTDQWFLLADVTHWLQVLLPPGEDTDVQTPPGT